ncbi:hypothetical protein GGR56DRAFT_118362 [Xylariaceae sp. FL0804]|nr:hypothetical protein GGR56DRAFT_118362 [Xylariaceae sp. FL0804]
MDYGRLRAAALRDGEDEEAVTVDTRALIDKVLARYSGEWTTLRELIQNAADAQATTVQIKWETLPSTQVPLPSSMDRSDILKHIITNHTLKRLVVQNNGQPFTRTDWGRLKRIAEGNPDETKIGAFGVGFYSVFSDCEEPFVSSGSEAMAFYWKGNALFTRKLQLPEDQSSSDTAFVLDYRNTTTTLPNILSVSQFLATSLTFVALQTIEFWIDDYKVLALTKKASPSVDVALSRDIETTTKERLMKVQSVERSSAQIDASYMSVVGWKPQVATAKSESYGLGTTEVPSLRSFFSRLTAHSTKGVKAAKEEKAAQEAISEDLTALSTSSIFLRVTTAAIKTSVTGNFAAELERATKKPPPKVTKLAILTSSYDETQASQSSHGTGAVSKATDIFASVLPSKKGGRIFIGFPTTQTTGAGMHISAPSIIPTVEREAIDLNARWVRTWNIEMLRAAGIMTRLAFSNEISELNLKLQRAAEKAGTKVTSKETAKYIPEALHLFNAFTFGDSTPSAHVSQIIEEAFWTSYKKPYIEMYSSRGVLPTNKVRLNSDEMAKFVDGIPVVPPELEHTSFVDKLTAFELLMPITVEDVRDELSGKPLNEAQLVSFIQWAGKKAHRGELDVANRDSLLGAAIGIMKKDGRDQGEIIALGTIKSYLNTNKITPGFPIPPTTIPFDYTKSCSAVELQALGWESLEIVPWLRFLIESRSAIADQQDITRTPDFATRVLLHLSKSWDHLSPSSKETVTTLLKAHTVMPTRMGMKRPTESYMPSVKLFDDLPIIECHGLKDKFTSAIGVRKTVDLEVIFKRLLNTSPEAKETGQAQWSHVELIKYLASVQNDIPPDDFRKLRASRICPSEVGPTGTQLDKPSAQLYKVDELFEPNSVLRPLHVKILQWPAGGLRRGSPEARFLGQLGLRSYPAVPELVDMMSSPNQSLRENAMSYFIDNYSKNGYVSFNIGTSTKAFIPLEGKPKQLVTPAACFTNEAAAALGFDILKKRLHPEASKLGVARDPPIQACVERLLNGPPRSHSEAVALFEYFSSRVTDLNNALITRLRDSPIVPVFRKKRLEQQQSQMQSAEMSHMRPRDCYLGSSVMYGDIFDFVDFGKSANAFLSTCGSKTEPTKFEIAQLAAGEPAKLLSVLQSPERYLNLLRSLADDVSTIKRDKDLWRKMKSAPFLLGFKEIRDKEKSADDEEADSIRIYQLAAPSTIVTVDDFISYRLFKDHLLCAPEEDKLEAFYQALGTPALSTIIQEELRIGSHSEKQEGAVWLRKHVLERSKLFIHEYPRNTYDAIKHDAKWLEKNLSVEVVRSIALRRSLRGQGQSHTEKRSAAINQGRNGWILYVASASPSAKPDMYQVGQAICQLILNRPSQQAYFFFEPFLRLELLDLRARGYNVDRILRAKAAEARIAEEERRKALESEQASIREREQEFRRQNEVATPAAREQNRTPPPRMPGGFGSPEDQPPPALPPSGSKKGKGLFSNLSKRFGFDANDEADEKLKNFVESTPNPVSLPPAGPSSSSGAKKDGEVTNPAVVQQNLLNAIKSTRAHDSSHLFSPPTTQQVKEQATYCDDTAGKDLTFVAEASNGMRVFVSNNLTTSSPGGGGGSGFDAGRFLGAHHGAINAFAALLRDVGVDVYQIKKTALHVFYDEQGDTIAFNRDGSIFANLRFYLQLHDADVGSGGGGEARAAAAVWWWVILAHELAHNIIRPHNADHSYYTESFIQQYFPKMMLKASQLVAAAAASQPPALAAAPAPGDVSTSRASSETAPPPYQ